MKKEGRRILVIDEETQIRRLLRANLTGQGYVVKDVDTGKDGLDAVAKFDPDLVLLDIELPDINGFDMLRKLREWSRVPVIIVSVKKQEKDKITALDIGAHDYLTKPFGIGELLARIRKTLRQKSESEEHHLKFDDLMIDLAHQRIFVDDKEIMLTPIEYKVLRSLAIDTGMVVTYKSLMRTVWGPSFEKKIPYLRVIIGQIRRKLEQEPSSPRHIITEPGVGYRLV
ncbi:response regulator with CheY-like receiver domain and winged-helix DNA-binding domain [Desulfosporosinus acidiphilus SJ4]|uniref:Stage 0 sporulation protein A homolog n=1 Tax=Desulfosporosinus acidiphilus (strain DSM 22704 / JCM 16185 / SJ4) TaxID=646529 RepID=I4D2D1_DESAJ|nr:response regulator [Desulfosporosinus acidiphilus]AFM39955.1 response regulator with CheY-like receiver domain and winged-helix DNA-binding domain [Desulfosporosinus acidiphilus SJ4]